MHPSTKRLVNFGKGILSYLLHDKLGLSTILALFTLAFPILATIYNVAFGVEIVTILKATGLSLLSILIVYFSQPLLGHVLNPLVHFYVSLLDKLDEKPIVIDGVGEVKIVTPVVESENDLPVELPK